MIFVISPAKKLDFSEETRFTQNYSMPAHMDDTEQLVKVMVKKSEKKIAELMSISPQLAALNYERYQNFTTPFTPENAKQALLAFKGDVYLSFDLESYSEGEFDFAQKHLRILSGLYGLLKPLDLIQPYRLEMGTKLSNRRGKNLYDFWGDRITKAINQHLEELNSDVLVNLASNEYFKSVKPAKLNARVITPGFKDDRNGQFKTIFLYAKQARGAMADFAIRNKINTPEGLKTFDGMGYVFNESLSKGDDWVFTR
ncbi:MAG: peroxide stress protein YaaA [Bacteroidetes bacterium]|nr:peroxide stress protein YaaA [Bacteroidota bacterium]MCB0843219.1 peroxide stress protein YaaA [Bacteroidota bacterium]